MLTARSLLLIFFVFMNGLGMAQDLAKVNEEIIGSWDLDMERTWEVYSYTKDHLSSKQIKEFEEFLTFFEVYRWIIREDGTASSSFKSNGRHLPSQNTKWKIEEVELTKNELKLIGKNPVFNLWAQSNTGITINADKQSKFILRCNDQELIVYDTGSPWVFRRVD